MNKIKIEKNTNLKNIELADMNNTNNTFNSTSIRFIKKDLTSSIETLNLIKIKEILDHLQTVNITLQDLNINYFTDLIPKKYSASELKKLSNAVLMHPIFAESGIESQTKFLLDSPASLLINNFPLIKYFVNNLNFKENNFPTVNRSEDKKISTYTNGFSFLLSKAADKNNKKLVLYLFNESKVINSSNFYSYTNVIHKNSLWLYKIINNNNFELIEEIIATNPTIQINELFTCAADLENKNFIKYLLENHSSKINYYKNDSLSNPIYYTIFTKSCLEIAEYLTAHSLEFKDAFLKNEKLLLHSFNSMYKQLAKEDLDLTNLNMISFLLSHIKDHSPYFKMLEKNKGIYKISKNNYDYLNKLFLKTRLEKDLINDNNNTKKYKI